VLHDPRASPTTPLGRSLIAFLWSDPRQRAVVALLVVTLAAAPVALVPDRSQIYAGIATRTPTLYTYTIAIALAGVVLAWKAPDSFLRGLLPWLPFLGWLMMLALMAWELSARTFSGVVHLCLGAAAFAIGAAAQQLDRNGWFMPWVFAAVAWVQLAAVALAAVGLPLRRISGPQALDVLGRATGLTSHPGELAKVLFFCGLGALTLPQRTWRERATAWLTVAAVLVGVSLSQSRTALVATVSMIVIFILLDARAARWQRKHLWVVGLILALGALSLPWLKERFAADPNGGARQHVMGVALAVIRQHPWAGVGPNGYVAVAGRSDPLTATGVPVHNIALLSAAELGILGAVLLWMPFVLVVVRAIAVLWRGGGTDLAARVVVSASPGVLLIAMTGWGLLQGPYFLMFSLIFGYFGARAGAEPPERR
jgi:O-antigen ligase